jgi:FkbM family methyltransferase
MRVFLDVGAHMGQTLAAVMPREFGFDRIVCFEPAANCWARLEELADDRVSIKRFGLWNCTTDAPLFQPGSKGAGLWKKDNGRTDETQLCRFVRATDWFREHVKGGDVVFLKLNCEGAECDILDDLLDSSEFEKVAFVMIDFDVRKIAALKHRQAEVAYRLLAYPYPRVATSKQVMRGETHAERIQHWLRLCR